jgi:glutaredoxin
VSRPTVTLYSRPGCHLCEAARPLLQRLATELGLHLVEVDIETDLALEREYGWAIPVVCFDGQELARAPIRPARLEEALRAAVSRAQAR